MAATFNIIFRIEGVLNGKSEGLGEIYAPYQITTSADIKSVKTVSVADTTATQIVTIGSGGDIASAVAVVLIPDVAGTLVWIGATDADNSSVVLAAGVPFILPTGNTGAYQATPGARAAEAAAAITEIWFYQTSGDAAEVEIFAVG